MRWKIWLSVSVLIVAGVIYWQVDKRLNAPLRPSGPEAQAMLAETLQAQNEQSYFVPTTPVVTPNTSASPKQVFFGDLHVHTRLSFDAYLFGTRLDPDTAYRIAKGEPAAVITGEPIQLHRPLDFVALTDHAEGFGLHQACSRDQLSEQAADTCQDFEEPSIAFFLRLRNSGEQRPPKRDLSIYDDSNDVVQEMAAATWQEIVAAADRHNEPGVFTTFAGYEYSPPLADTGKHHRNVIFRSSVTPDHAVSAYDADSEIDLWKQLAATCTGECEFLTIPHNPNKSWGLAFASETIDGVPYTEQDWALRTQHEPIVEMFQIKGNSECSSAFGASDEECDFEQFLPPCEPGQSTLCIFPTSMVRDGLKRGLALESELGFNPMRFGLIGSTDTHNANPGDAEEWDYRGASGYATSPARRRLSSGRGGSRSALERNPGGLAAVWAEENTRDALFDAMQRREVYATSGTRIRLRTAVSLVPETEAVMQGSALPDDWPNDGMPMGSALTAQAGLAPILSIWAVQDPMHAALAKVQVVKGWVDHDGVLQEEVVDVACAGSGDLGEFGQCRADWPTPAQDCRWDTALGQREFKVSWRDPSYDASLNTFYYVRVLQIPTCRWSTYDSLRLGIEPPADLPTHVQEMAWASPTWIKPD